MPSSGVNCDHNILKGCTQGGACWFQYAKMPEWWMETGRTTRAEKSARASSKAQHLAGYPRHSIERVCAFNLQEHDGKRWRGICICLFVVKFSPALLFASRFSVAAVLRGTRIQFARRFKSKPVRIDPQRHSLRGGTVREAALSLQVPQYDGMFHAACCSLRGERRRVWSAFFPPHLRSDSPRHSRPRPCSSTTLPSPRAFAP